MSFGVLGAITHRLGEKVDGAVERALFDEPGSLAEAWVAVERGVLSEQRGGAHRRQEQLCEPAERHGASENRSHDVEPA